MNYRKLLRDVRACRICAAELPHAPRPVVQLHPDAKVLIVGQAPGRKVHASGKPFDDASGERLRNWLGVSLTEFYDPHRIALVPMGLCFPGTRNGADLPPLKACETAWRAPLLACLPNVELTLVLGRYAQDYHCPEVRGTLTERVSAWRLFWPERVPLPHPSPRNTLWFRRNAWVEAELIPRVRHRVQEILAA